MSKTSDTFVSVVVPLRDDADVVETFVRELMDVLRSSYTNYELVLIDDGSRDDTPKRIGALLSDLRCVRYIRLSRSFGAEVAIAAGLDSVIGDYVVIMSPDSDPPAIVPEVVERARRGTGIVFGVCKAQHVRSLWSRAGSKLFHAAAERLFNLEIPRNAGTLMVLSRQAVNGVTRIKDKYRSLRLLSRQVGYDSDEFPYDAVPRRARPRARGFGESLSLATALVVSHSTRPLRLVAGVGLIASCFNLLYVGYVVAVFLLKRQVAEGWTTTSLQMSIMFFLLFAILAVLSEYVGRILDESKDRPLYHVLEERHSTVLVADADRRNVVKESAAGTGT